MIINWGSISHW